MKITLPFPSSLLAGNGSAFGGAQWKKIKAVKDHREWARVATLSAMGSLSFAADDEQSDVSITIRFVPPNKRGDRVGYPYRMKPYFDGIADALKINDRRFHPMFIFCEPEKPGRVDVYIHGVLHNGKSTGASYACGSNLGKVQKKNGRSAAPTAPDRDQTLNEERSI